MKTTAEPLWLACLCAAWCRTCTDYMPVLAAVAAEIQVAAPGLRVRWIDIEDEADLVGDCDIETFPTIALVDASAVRFFGPLTPQPETLRRLLRARVDGAGHVQPVDAEVEAFAARLRACVGYIP
jgi:thioredoxin-like negative regulator of GroEL